jgi:hypothetical protein
MAENALLKDPLLFSIVAGQFGKALSNEGSVGQALGGTSVDLARALKFAKASETKEAQRKDFMELLMEYIRGNMGGGVSSGELPGPNAIKIMPDKIAMDISTKGAPSAATGRAGLSLSEILGPF